MLRVHIAWHGEARLQDLLRVVQRSLQQVLEVLILRHVLVAGLLPLSYGLHRNKPQGLCEGTAREAAVAAASPTPGLSAVPPWPGRASCSEVTHQSRGPGWEEEEAVGPEEGRPGHHLGAPPRDAGHKPCPIPFPPAW